MFTLNKVLKNKEITMECDSTDDIPLAKPEKITNSKCPIIFLIFMFLYAGVAIYVFSYVSTVSNEELNKIMEKNSNISHLIFTLYDIELQMADQVLRKDGHDVFTAYSNYFNYSGLTIFIYVFVTFITTLLCILLTEKISRISIQILIVIDCLLCIKTIINLFSISTILELKDEATILYLIIMKNILFLCDYYVKIYAIYHLGIKIICDVVEESCRAIRASPILILLSFLSSTLILLMIFLMQKIYRTIQITDTSDPKQLYLIIFHCTNFVCGTWFISFIFGCTQIICARTISIWFYTTQKSSFINGTAAESIVITLRYYLATAIYASSPWALFISTYIFIKHLANKVYGSRYNIFVLIVCYWSTFLTLFNGSCIMTAIHGTSFKKSADSACRIYLKNPLQLYTINKGMVWCITSLSIIFGLIYGIIFAGAIGYEFQKLSTDDILNFMFSILIFILPTIILIVTAVLTITLCIFKELEYEIPSSNRPSIINTNL